MAVAMLVLLVGCSDVGRGPARNLDDGGAEHERVDATLRERLLAGEEVDAVVLLASAVDEKSSRALSAGNTHASYAAWANAVIAAHVGSDVAVLARYRHFPMLAMRIWTVEGLDALAADAHVVRIDADEPHEASLTESLSLIGQPAAAVAGFQGSGKTVAVLDTGCDYTHSAFGTCTSPGDPLCKVVAAQDFAPDDSELDSMDSHGTNVAAIVLGVAPMANIAALDVFRDDGLAYTSDVLSAIDWVVENKNTYDIAAMNLSLGSGSSTTRCASSPFETALQTARDAGVLAAVATGNSGLTNATEDPACAPSAVAVGAVFDSDVGTFSGSCSDESAADKVACFSNSASFVDLLAPGAPITAADITMSGTSQASAHVAGAIAVLRAAFPDDTADETLMRLTSNGVSVTDERNNVVTPRLDLEAAVTVEETNDPPENGTVVIGNGDLFTGSRDVLLNIGAEDTDGVAEMCVSNTSSCSAWVQYETTYAWELTSGSGAKTVRVWFKDTLGNETEDPVTASITLDVTAPSNGSVMAVAGDEEVALSWSGFADAASGVTSYKVVQQTSSAPASCEDGSVVYEGGSTSTTVTSLTNGTTYGFRVCAIDGVNNVSTGGTATAQPSPPSSAPTGSVTINANASATRTTSVTLTISASDTDGLASMCISNTTTCSTWVAYATSKAWTLASGNGTRAVYVRCRGLLGNVSAAPETDTIVLDVLAPTNGTATATGGNAQVALSWSGFTDTGTGIASYKVVYQAGSVGAPGSCSTGTFGYAGTSTSTTISALTNGTTYGFRVCAIDAIGNVSTGVVKSARPAPEYDAPTGSISINAGAATTGSTSVTLTLSASDASGVGSMCITSTGSCSTWVPYAASKAWTLPSGTGTKSVDVWFRDIYGNMSAAFSDTIVLDQAGPANGSVDAVGGNAQVALSWTGYTDTHSTIASYKVVYLAGATAPASCATGTVAYSGVATSTTVSSLTNGTTYAFRVCAIDAVGNVSTGAVKTSRPAPEYDAPTGTVTINGGAASTRSTTATLTLSASDASSVSSMCISNTTTCTAWVAYAASKTWTLVAGSGTKTVRVWFRDVYGNASAAAVSASIVLDTTLPTNGTLTATGGNAQVALSWSGYADTHTAVASYKVVYQTGTTAPASCSVGTVAYTGTSTSRTVTSLTNGTTYAFRVCAIDTPGNMSTGTTKTAKPAPEYAAPASGSVRINNGAVRTTSRTVTLALQATDDSGVASVCISNTTTCTAWIAYATSKSWTLTTGYGTKTVRVWFRDTYGNATAAAVSASITYGP